MNYRHYLVLIATLAAVGGCDQMQSGARTDTGNTAISTPMVEGEVVATVNGTPLTQDVLDIYATQRKAQGGDEEANSQEAILNELISLELMRQDSIKKGLNTQPFVIAAIDQQTRTALAGAAIKDFMANNPVSDEAAQALYDEQIGVAVVVDVTGDHREAARSTRHPGLGGVVDELATAVVAEHRVRLPGAAG